MNDSEVSQSRLKSNFFWKRVIRKIVVLSTIFLVGLFVLSVTAMRPAHLGIRDGKLAPVPDSPNCVSSLTEKSAFFAEPFDVTGQPKPLEKLKQSIKDHFPRSRLITEQQNYLHYEFTSLIFRFVDDAEFLLDPQAGLIHFRSASRVGYSDLGANRNRMEKIRAALDR